MAIVTPEQYQKLIAKGAIELEDIEGNKYLLLQGHEIFQIEKSVYEASKQYGSS